jgi:hypothetical protein
MVQGEFVGFASLAVVKIAADVSPFEFGRDDLARPLSRIADTPGRSSNPDRCSKIHHRLCFSASCEAVK